MHIEPHQLELVRTILCAHIPERKVWAFGSRVTGEHLKPFSDLDLAIGGAEPLEWNTLANLREAFSASNLPFRVDLVDWATTSEAFRQIIRLHRELINTTGSNRPPPTYRDDCV